jgi:hypothetical protein
MLDKSFHRNQKALSSCSREENKVALHCDVENDNSEMFILRRKESRCYNPKTVMFTRSHDSLYGYLDRSQLNYEEECLTENGNQRTSRFKPKKQVSFDPKISRWSNGSGIDLIPHYSPRQAQRNFRRVNE